MTANDSIAIHHSILAACLWWKAMRHGTQQLISPTKMSVELSLDDESVSEWAA